MNNTYYFYIVESLSGRIGFGIAQNIHERNKQYCSHAGDIVKMAVYGGQRTHAKALERTIKTKFVDDLWKMEDWTTEWLNKDIDMSTFKKLVDELIAERHYRVSLLATDFDFRKSITS